MGKVNSKLKRKNRAQSMAWNFRFPSVTSLSVRKKGTVYPNMSIKQWLTILNLTQYELLFENFKGVEDVMRYTNEDLKDLGVKNDIHCMKMTKSLDALKLKYEQRGIKTASGGVVASSSCGSKGATGNSAVSDKTAQRHSVAVDPTILINHNPTESDILVIKNFNQSKSLSNIKMEAVSPEVDSDPVQLKKILEWELSLDTRDLRSHAWYHGAIPRIRAEEIVGEQDGDFLVRDCTSQPGNYVLSCRNKSQNLHFVINKIVLQPDTVYERIQYRFEEDGYDTVPDLITYYVGSGKFISSASGAKIQTPRNRMYPLSFYANKYDLQHQQQNPNYDTTMVNSSMVPPAVNSNMAQHLSSSYCSPINSPPRVRRENIPKLPTKKQRSLSLLSSDMNSMQLHHSTECNGATQKQSFSNSLPRHKFSTKLQLAATSTLPRGKLSRLSSEPAFDRMSNGSKCDPVEDPPPKPSRISSFVTSKDLNHIESIRKNCLYHTSGSDSGNGSGDSVQSSIMGDGESVTPMATLQRRSSGVVIKYPKYFCQGISSSSSLTTLKAAYSYDTVFEDPTLCDFRLPSVFDLDSFHTLLLPMAENKPLDCSALQGLHVLLQDSGSRILANHITRTDLELTLNDKCYAKLPDTNELAFACGCGIELCLLPHGRQLRLDLIERTECIKLLVAVTILTCSSDSERAEILNKWIEVAIDTKTALGNLFGFASIMLGLSMPQIQRLNSTWHILRQKYTDSAFNFEAKLRPTLKNMNECTNPLAPNTTIPHLMPAILLFEQTLDDISGNTNCDKNNMITSWENSTGDLGLSILYSHLENARQYCQLISTFKRNSEIVLSDSKIDDLLVDMFRTEFHLKFLWGSRGAVVTSSERFSKFEQVLNVMSEKCELSETCQSLDQEIKSLVQSTAV